MIQKSTLQDYDFDNLSEDDLAELDRLFGEPRTPEPPWHNPLAKKESELVAAAYATQNPGDTRKADFYISWLAARYECSPLTVQKAIVQDFNRGATEWAAFNFRFVESYQFAHDRLFPQTGEVRILLIYLWKGRAISEADARKLGLEPTARPKKLRAVGRKLYVLGLREPPDPFLKEATKKLHKLSPSQIESASAEVEAWLEKSRKRASPSLDTLRLRFWDLMLQEAYGEGAYTGQRLVPPTKKLENFEKLCSKNNKISLSVASIYKT
jgi:hypothetical protein